jgi:hypothetical protein
MARPRVIVRRHPADRRRRHRDGLGGRAIGLLARPRHLDRRRAGRRGVISGDLGEVHFAMVAILPIGRRALRAALCRRLRIGHYLLALIVGLVIVAAVRTYLTGVAKGLYDYERIESRDVDVRIHGDVAVMSGVVDMSIGLTIQPKASISLLFVPVWLTGADSWQLTYRPATRRQ